LRPSENRTSEISHWDRCRSVVESAAEGPLDPAFLNCPNSQMPAGCPWLAAVRNARPKIRPHGARSGFSRSLPQTTVAPGVECCGAKNQIKTCLWERIQARKDVASGSAGSGSAMVAHAAALGGQFAKWTKIDLESRKPSLCQHEFWKSRGPVDPESR
jgi:hypothetical protein